MRAVEPLFMFPKRLQHLFKTVGRKNRKERKHKMLTLCDSGHDEVCFEGRTCPVCEKIKEISDLEDLIRDKVYEIGALEDRVAELESLATKAENRVAELESLVRGESYC